VSAPPALDGRFGLRLDAPPEWRLLEDKELAAVWRAPGEVLVLASHIPEPLLVDPELVDDYRHDLRLVAAARGGGLLSCELDARLGLVGITKEPKPRSEGITAVARLLVPALQGHVAVSIVAHEQEPPGARDAEQRADPATSGADPYGFTFPAPAGDGPGALASAASGSATIWPARLRLATPSDAAELDAKHPEHPLSRVREVLALVRARAERTLPPHPRPTSPVHLDRVQLDLPLGFLASGDGKLAHGQLWRRVTFEKRLTFLVVTRHPQSKEAGRSVVEATRLVESQLATARALVRRGPRVAAATVGGQPGVLAEVEARMGGAAAGGRGDGHPTYAATFFLPWSDHTLEVTVFGEADDAPRLRATLERVVASAQAAGKPAMVPDTTRIAGEVTPAGRRRVYRLLCHLATRNREVGAKEREVLEQERVSLLVTREEADALEAEGREGKKLDLSKAAPEQRLLLDAMIDLVAADGVLEHEEQRRLLEIAVAAGIPRATVTERLLERLSSGGRP